MAEDSNAMQPSTGIDAVGNQEKVHEGHVTTVENVRAINSELTRGNSYEDENHVQLGWRSWLVVLITLWG